MENQIIKDLNWRYTTKMYDETKRISTEDMQVIKEALRMSASSINSQPWKFVVIESDEAKQRFSKTFENNFQFNQHHATKASHCILFGNKTHYTKEDYKKVVDVEVSSGHLPQERAEDMLNGAFAFAELNSDENGFNGNWTKAQTYIALGNLLHTLTRLGIDSTPMEGVDSKAIGEIFAKEFEGYECTFAIAMGYHKKSEDYNFGLPKARLAQKDIIEVL
ncbi:nitroreductase family protein [uncultured Lutibacter sp.]|uniref:nitroreductase family protein n=1 Tax=uncultured Lutibacter sp. TaxID=437739 RepID=UPI002638DCF4|nr:nitroreductase family protein [uncultured Lutibacter sp.]